MGNETSDRGDEGGKAAWGKAAWIDAFSGWAGPGGGMLYARVHAGSPPSKPRPDESSFRRLEETIQTLELSALPDADVVVTGVDGVDGARADEHGFIALPLPAGLAPGPRRVGLRVASAGFQPAEAELVIQVWPDSVDRPGRAIVSDIDDTLTDTGVTHKARMLLNTFFHSEFELKIFDGAAAAMNAASFAGTDGLPFRPSIYLSGSPWALQDRISEAFDRAGLPLGAMILRRFSKEPLDAFDYKYPHLQTLLGAFPNHRFIFFGDSGEKDPEVYARIRADHPAQVEHIFIHLVTDEDSRSGRFAGMTVFKDWNAVATELGGLG